MIIDFHTHTFPDKIASRTVDHLATVSRTKPFSDGSEGGLISSMEKNSIDYSVSLPVMTKPAQTEKINPLLAERREELLSQHIVTFGGIHPGYENYKEILKLLKDNGVPGIKIHPAYQNMDLDDLVMKRIIAAASELDLIVLTHAGIDIGIYDHNYASVKMALNIIEDVRPDKFVLAHMGGWACWDQVESDLCGAPVYFDTAFSLGKVTSHPTLTEPPYKTSNLDEESFVRIIRKHGAEKILFATDSPWEDQGDYVQRMMQTSLTSDEKEAIFYNNAAALLQLSSI